MSDILLSALYRYPVKSLAGESLSQARLDAFGLHRDRRWMLVDREGRSLSQRDRTAFSDGFPLLLISQASLNDLNSRLAEPLPMLRFRPNLVVEGCAPYAEDGWRHIRIGDLTLRVVKPCSRCKITTVDPYTAETGSEPLQTLAGYRRRGNQVYLGQNLVHDGPGELALGMPVELLE
jgi:uncharacterized protein YcbX